MKQIEGLTEENGTVYYEYNGEKINLTEIGDECGQFHMRKAMKMLIERTGLDTKVANDIMYQAYSMTPPNRAKNQERAAKIQENNEEISRLKEAKRQVKEIAAQRKAKG